ncbi:radical SAM/SPASM domain-containing protein [Sulfolobus acidocaldarius]|uniref:Radical SAM/SPASM domain-containing protein n=1 Tax=Sulfolobus acidocaldarius TaxID=2285 RepID=A0A0U3FWA2_9CREN|nr:radical SAM/SPASM domain-containing protein [Sulfolobus acidocaldarius]ALU29253.1 radical SAM/SPASM domain-containing protein [Sulfolobus acidocaldarius]ALU31982.1 radical SAM/SPASM domain-containing protein [Sulfolobus acidocaldarius]
MLWLVLTTGKCNLTCDYCGGSFPKEAVPWEVKYDVSKLKNVIERDSEAVVIFYGGEPLLNPKFIMSVMDNVKAVRWGIQSNGIGAKLLPDKYWKRMNIALFSIDGREEITDKHRGRGVYKVVTRNAKYVKEFGVETIARMAVTEDSDIYEEVMHLLSLGIFDKVHWQLNVIWSERWDFETWAYKSYLPGLRRLYEYFMSELRRGRIVKIVPFLGVISSHFFKKYRGVACGAGYESISVSTDGRILSCPIAVREKWAELGTLESFRLLDEPLPEECKSCEFKSYCGGRCLYAVKEKYWGEEGFKVVDEVTKEYLRLTLSGIEEIKELIRDNVISLSDLKYDPVMDSTEVIP